MMSLDLTQNIPSGSVKKVALNPNPDKNEKICKLFALKRLAQYAFRYYEYFLLTFAKPIQASILNELPTEILWIVFERFSHQTLFSMRLVSREWNTFIDDMLKTRQIPQKMRLTQKIHHLQAFKATIDSKQNLLEISNFIKQAQALGNVSKVVNFKALENLSLYGYEEFHQILDKPLQHPFENFLPLSDMVNIYLYQLKKTRLIKKPHL